MTTTFQAGDELAGTRTRPWRAYGLALLPLALLGWMPWWVCLGLCAVYALGVRFPAWESGRLLVSLLVLGLGWALMLPGADLSEVNEVVRLAVGYLLGTLAVVVLNLAAARLESAQAGRRWGLAAVGLVALPALHPGLLLALAGGALATEHPDDRQRTGAPQPNRALWAWVAAALAAALVLSAALPRTSLLDLLPSGGTRNAPAASAPLAPTEAPGQAQATPEGQLLPPTELPFQLNIGPLWFNSEMFLFLGFLFLLAGGLHMRRAKGTGVPPRLIDALMTAGLLLTGLLWITAAALLYLSANRAGQGAGQAANQGEAQGGIIPDLGNLLNFRSARLIDITALTNILAVLSAVLVIALIILLVALRPPKASEGSPEVLPGDPTGPGERGAPPLHRVRLAYRQAEAALTVSGFPRPEAETPAGYARRLGAELPPLRLPLAALTRAYQPVRYGGVVNEDDAETAEQAALQIEQELRALAPPDPPDESLAPSPAASLARKDLP